MKKLLLFLSIIFVISGAGIAGAAIYTFQPNDPGADLDDLDHYKYYTWGINWTPPEGENITGASLFFDNIKNWDNNPNDLYGQLLDSAKEGVYIGWDDEEGGNYFEGKGVELFHWKNLSNNEEDKTYDFSAEDINFLKAYIANDGNFGLGLDPDCHFFNDGVTLKIETAAVPVPATIFLFGSGLIGIARISRNKGRKK